MFNISDYNQKMDKTIEVFNKELSTLRTGRANSKMLDLIKVDVYGQKMPIDGQLIRLPIPDLSEERRNEMKKMIKTMGEKCKVSIRNIRREANDELKDSLKKKVISEDEEIKFEKQVQNYTDNHIKIIDEKVVSKEKEIMTI